MSFSSIPTYLDPSNWQQQPNSQNGGFCAIPNQQNHQLSSLPQPAPPLPPKDVVRGCTAVPVRPGSMSERARLANIPVPEAGLKCPRCESTNTKFCYFNNYNLSQPRHFCKTCRRYWTRGGGLRTVPVGGGCRRNKRNKNTSSKPSISQTTSSSPSTISSSGHGGPQQLVPPNPHVAGFDYTSFPLVDIEDINNQTVTVTPSDSLEQWRLHQYPFWGGLDPSLGNGSDRFQVGETSGDQMREKPFSSMLTQMDPMKTEENQGILLRRNVMGISCNDTWSGASYIWSDLTTFNSCSNSNAL